MRHRADDEIVDEGRADDEIVDEGRADVESETKTSILFYSRQRKSFLDFSISSLNQFFIIVLLFILQTNNQVPRKLGGLQHQRVG